LINAVVEDWKSAYLVPVPGEAILIRLLLKFRLLKLPVKYAPHTDPVVVAVDEFKSIVLW
jgi:hypothetical protein